MNDDTGRDNEQTLPPDQSPKETVGLRHQDSAIEHVDVPGYDLEQEIGRGGMGVVYKARHHRLNRVVALKMILSGAHASPEDVQRFTAEAEAVAALTHTNIVQVYEVGQHENRPYMALEYVSGGSLESKLKPGPLSVEEAAGLVRQTAVGMQAAHDAGIVHRDLKPANILITEDSVPKVTDFGLAKRVEGGSGLTQTGAVMGTPSYMAPEQAAGEGKRVGPAADVYALGAILYETLAGRPPFKAATTIDTLLEVIEREPAPIRMLNPKVDRDLEAICFKCLEKNPQQRYRSAAELARDLEAYLKGEPISVRSINLLDRLTRSLERSHFDSEFHDWSKLLYGWAAVIFITHLVLCFIVGPHHYKLLNAVIYIAQMFGMGIVYWIFGPRRLRPAGASEQLLWAVWTGYLIGCFTMLPITAWCFRDKPELDYTSYCFASLMAGIAFFCLGASHWGRYYAFGTAFFLLSVVMIWNLEYASLEYGSLWAFVLVMTGRHVHGLARKAKNED